MHPTFMAALRTTAGHGNTLNVHGTDEDGTRAHTHTRAHTRVQAPATQPLRKGSDALEMTTPSKANQTREREIP